MRNQSLSGIEILRRIARAVLRRSNPWDLYIHVVSALAGMVVLFITTAVEVVALIV